MLLGKWLRRNVQEFNRRTSREKRKERYEDTETSSPASEGELWLGKWRAGHGLKLFKQGNELST